MSDTENYLDFARFFWRVQLQSTEWIVKYHEQCKGSIRLLVYYVTDLITTVCKVKNDKICLFSAIKNEPGSFRKHIKTS